MCFVCWPSRCPLLCSRHESKDHIPAVKFDFTYTKHSFILQYGKSLQYVNNQYCSLCARKKCELISSCYLVGFYVFWLCCSSSTALIDGNVGQLVHQSRLNYLNNFLMDCHDILYIDIHVPQRMNPSDSGDPLIFLVMPPRGSHL